jgi:hypothetical protein
LKKLAILLCYASTRVLINSDHGQFCTFLVAHQGLLVNYTKSSATLLQCEPEDAHTIATRLGCPIVDMPLTYLGIPLTVRRLTSAQMQPVAGGWLHSPKLEGWVNEQGQTTRIGEVCARCHTHTPTADTRPHEEDHQENRED